MTNPQASPISQLLNTLGITREELSRRSDQMRHFLTADSTFSSRVSGQESSSGKASSSSKLRSNSVSTTSGLTSARSFSRASSSSLRDASPPPSTPVKSEPMDVAVPQRQFDSMEIVIERQRLARKEKKDRRGKRDRAAPPSPSPSASRGSVSVDLARDDEAGASSSSSTRQSPPPLTPQQSKYYRAHTATQSSNGIAPSRTESPTPSRAPSTAIPANALHYYYPQYTDPPTGQPASDPVTPTPMRIIRNLSSRPSPLPPSSPPPMPSPISSPVRGIINLVSSPGPMGPGPKEDDYDGLPYTLPPGPYMSTKPECSYAAILGQAILSSPEHRLTLQEIYDWITIVYPFFKRGETTWMNSIRHVLSTTVVFRKVVRERALGRTQWAIWDEDMPCFKDGGFRKQLCSDMRPKDKAGPSSAVKRPRSKGEDSAEAERKAKKPRNSRAPLPLPSASHPIFPPARPTPHHQSYYDSCVTRSLSTDVLFPPLPPSAIYRKVSDGRAISAAASIVDAERDLVPEPSSPLAHKWTPPTHLASSQSSSSSLPSLTPSGSSSSPPISTSDIDVDVDENVPDGIKVVEEEEVRVVDRRIEDEDVDDFTLEPYIDDVFSAPPKLNPVQFWGDAHAKDSDSLQPGIQLQYAAPAMLMGSDDEDDEPIAKPKGKRQRKSKTKVPQSPTLRLRSNPRKSSTKSRLASPPVMNEASSSSSARLTTPPPKSLFSSYLSPIRTPISHKGFHMSPSASLVHYKSNLDPPPVTPYSLHLDDEEHDPLKTPSKKRTISSGGGLPVTPRRLFPLASDSPFRTPGNVMASPFRGVYDPHDTSAMLDDELNRMTAAGHGDSPAGLFGRSRAQLLYNSPGQSPGKVSKWW